jgi:amino acid efflux transporter
MSTGPRKDTPLLTAEDDRDDPAPTARSDPAALSVLRGAALYLGALIGPGLLLIPTLAVQAAGAASILAWAGLLVLSAPLVAVFIALGVQQPVAGGVAAYVRAGFGPSAAAATGACFLTAVVLGAPAVSLIGGYYVAELTGHGTLVAAEVGAAMLLVVLAANLLGLRISSRLQLVLSYLLVAVVAAAVIVALPGHAGDHWRPFAPHGWWAIGTAANILVWLFIGWEAAAPMAADYDEPERDLPRAAATAFGVVTVLYMGLATATIAVTSGTASKVPLADLVSIGFGRAGREATAVLAVALTMGTMNVYIGGAAKLAAALALDGALPGFLGADAHRTVPRRPLWLIFLAGATVLALVASGTGSTDGLVRATSACFVAVYVLTLAAACRLVGGQLRGAALVALALMAVVGAFSEAYLLVPLGAATLAIALRRRLARSPA